MKDHTDIELLEMTAVGRKALARRRAQEAADGTASFAGVPHLEAANRGRHDGAEAGKLHHKMGRREPTEDEARYLATGAQAAAEPALVEPDKTAYVNAYAAAHRAAYRAAERSRLLGMTATGRKALARDK